MSASASIRQRETLRPLSRNQQRVMDELRESGVSESGPYRFGVDRPYVRVYDTRLECSLVAYSELRSDYEESLDEFIRWYA